MDFAQAQLSSAPQDDYDDYDSPEGETTPTVPPPTQTTPTSSQDLGYFSQSTSSSLELSQSDQPLTSTTSHTLPTLSTTTPAPTHTLTTTDTPGEALTEQTTVSKESADQPTTADEPLDQEGSSTEGHSADSAIPALIPDNMTIEELYAKVKKLFPGFKPHSILRFSSLLGPGKRSSLPQVWKGAMKPKRKSGKKKGELKLDIDFVPPPEMIMESDEVRSMMHH